MARSKQGRRQPTAHRISDSASLPAAETEAIRRRHLESIIEGIADGVIVVDDDGLVHFHNRVAAEVYGVADHQVLPSAFQLTSTTAGANEVDLLSADGRQLTVELRAAPIAWNGRGCRLVSIRDATARKQSEQRVRQDQDQMRQAVDRQNGDLIDAYDKLRQLALDRRQFEADLFASEDRFRLAFEQVGGGKIVFDDACRILSVNRSLCEMLGYDADDLLGRNLADLVETAGARLIANLVDRLSELERPMLSAQMHLRTASGESLPGRVTATVLRRGQGLPVRGLVLVEDMTEQIHWDEVRREQQRLAAIGSIAAGIAHEIKNPVGASLLAAETGMRMLGAESPASTRECFADIIAAMERCGRILRSTLRLSPLAPRERPLGRLNEVVLRSRDLVLATWRRGPAAIVLNLDPADPEIAMNELEIELALINLANNALQNGSETTSVVMTTAASPDRVTLSVADDGPGMTPAQTQRACDPFFTTRRDQGGSGLGLSLVHGVVVSHQGTIDIESEPGRGTTVRICLPRFSPEVPAVTTT